VDLHARLATADIIWEVEFALWQILFVKPMIKIAEFVSAAMLDITWVEPSASWLVQFAKPLILTGPAQAVTLDISFGETPVSVKTL
jgi:hypothetical protein